MTGFFSVAIGAAGGWTWNAVPPVPALGVAFEPSASFTSVIVAGTNAEAFGFKACSKGVAPFASVWRASSQMEATQTSGQFTIPDPG